jgi:hypothetical protein
MALTASTLAAELRVAMAGGTVQSVLAAHLADPVGVHHDPPLPSDGPMARTDFTALLLGNPMEAVVPDGVRTYSEPSVDGKTVTFDSTLVGTTTTGEPIRIANTTVITARGGLITKLVQRYDPAMLDALTQTEARQAD